MLPKRHETDPAPRRRLPWVAAGRGQRFSRLVPARKTDLTLWLLILCLALALILKAAAPAIPPTDPQTATEER